VRLAKSGTLAEPVGHVSSKGGFRISVHDGWVFPAKDEAQVLRVKDVFEHVGSEMLGQPMPVKHVIWN
jgi:hypothetical protein